MLSFLVLDLVVVADVLLFVVVVKHVAGSCCLLVSAFCLAQELCSLMEAGGRRIEEYDAYASLCQRWGYLPRGDRDRSTFFQWNFPTVGICIDKNYL